MNKLIMYIIVGSIFLLLLVRVGSQFQSSRTTFFDKHHNALSISNKVTGIETDSAQNRLLIQIGAEQFAWQASEQEYERIRQQLAVGDSLYKAKNSMQVLIYRKQSLLDSFQFECYSCDE
jgi:hypothetical protein